MAAGRFVVPPYFPARNRDFDLLSGAKLYVYDNLTTDKANIYTDEALTVLSANPVIANSSGQFPAIWAQAGTEAEPVLYSVSVTTSTGASPGNPFNFDNYRPSVDWETAAAALAEAAAALAVAEAAAAAVSADEAAADAVLTAADLAAIEAIIADAPDAPSVLNKLNRDGDNASAGLLANIGEQYPDLSAMSAPIVNSDVLAGYRSGLKRFTASVFADYIKAFFSASGGSELVGSIQSGTGAAAETVQTTLRRAVYPEQFGAVGNGSTNDATALGNAMTAAVALNATLMLMPGKDYRINTGLTAPANLVMSAYGATISTAANITLITGAANVKIWGLKFKGPSSAYNASSIGFTATGTVNGAAVAPTFIAGIELTDCQFEDIGYIAIYPFYVERMKVVNPTIRNCGYAGVITIGCRDFEGHDGLFETFSGETGSGDLEAYGVSWSGNELSTDFVRYPPSTRCIWHGGLFRNILTGTPVDTHGGVDSGFLDPVIVNCRRIAWITGRPGAGPIRCFALNAHGVNTTAELSTNSNGQEQRDTAFLINGDTTTFVAEGCEITGTAIGFGAVASRRSGLSITRTDQACSTDVKIISPYTAGISLGSGARGYHRAVIENPQSPSSGGFTTSPRYVDIEAIGSEVVNVTLDVDMVRSNTALNTYVGLRAFVSSGSLANMVCNFHRLSYDDGIDMSVSSDRGTVTGRYPFSWAIDVTGIDSVTSASITGQRDGNLAVLTFPIITGTSNSSAFTMGASAPLPTYLRSANFQFIPVTILDNSTAAQGQMQINTDGTFILTRDLAGSSWTGSGTKRLIPVVVRYPVT